MSDAATRLHDLFEAHHQFRMEASPEFATYEGDHRYNELLTDMSEAAEQKQLAATQDFRAQLDTIALSELSESDQMNHEMFAMMLDEAIEGARFRLHELPINQMTGYQLSMPHLIDFQPLKTAAQFPAYFSRLRGFTQQSADVLENMRQGMQHKRVQPRHLMEQVLPQIEQLISGSAQDSVFYIPLKQNTELSESERAALDQELTEIIETVIKPGYQRMYDFIKEDYLPACRDTHGIWDLPEGEAMYKYFIKMYTTPDLTADEIHEIGLKEVARIHALKEEVKNKLGFKGSVTEFNLHLRNSPDQIFESKEALWSMYERVMNEGIEKSSALFHSMPKALCTLKEVEEYKAKSAPQAYYMPPPEDGSRPGVYYLNTFDLPSRPKYAVTALTLHEAVPGHHLQISVAQELENMPYFRRKMHVTAYIEGWGLYSEYLGHDLDMYQDPYQYYGSLSFEMWRACRLVVDTGLHHKRWTRQQAIDFMKQQMANSDHDIASEVDRYMILPGQALSYKIGEIDIKNLRKRSEEALGEKFDIRDFHDVVLRNGAVPLAVLEEQVDHWLQSAAR